LFATLAGRLINVAANGLKATVSSDPDRLRQEDDVKERSGEIAQPKGCRDASRMGSNYQGVG
jgi:hypothetical protein